ncbi:MAG: 7-cyano-7-deazaguanine synthase QueC [Bacteroidales bacterium]|nr:7-cyano-7-deazaguanine synthase QueC [Bacteroidales bacterium]
MKSEESALVLFSGGQDSTTCLFWAKKEFKEVRTVGFNYGQRHNYEVEVAKTIAKIADVPFELITIDILSKTIDNSLTNLAIEVQPKPENALPNTFVPGRNLILLTYASILARSFGIKHIVTGISQTDFSGYPDCREKFVKSAQKTINLALETDIEIHTPLMFKNKEVIWQLSDELGVFDLVRHNTLTCYNGIMADGCGKCPSCLLRNNGLTRYLKKREKLLRQKG